MKKTKALTFLEVLVVLGISMVIISVSYQLYFTSQKFYHKQLIKSDLIQNARIAQDRISREIRQTPAIITTLPSEEEGYTLSTEIMFQDGHNTSKIRYITYYLSTTDLKRKISHYFFPADPNTWVHYGARDEGGNPPQVAVDEDRILAENITELTFYGEDVIYLKLKAQKENQEFQIKTAARSRNL